MTIPKGHRSGDDCGCEMCNPPECGCEWNEQHLMILYCKLHNNAERLADALRRLAEKSQWSVSSGVNETAEMRLQFNRAIDEAKRVLKDSGVIL